MRTEGVQVWDITPPSKLDFSRTLVAHSSIVVPEDLADHGYQFLDKFEVVLVLLGLKTTAAQMKDRLALDLTKQRCRTLYLPMYDGRMIWLRRGYKTTEFLKLWRKERLALGNSWLPLLRALYQARLKTWVLPSIG